jgi:hypothetical protein
MVAGIVLNVVVIGVNGRMPVSCWAIENRRDAPSVMTPMVCERGSTAKNRKQEQPWRQLVCRARSTSCQAASNSA